MALATLGVGEGRMDDETLERCTAKLREAGLWGGNLSAVSVDDAGDIARQLVDELGLCIFDELVDWLVYLIGQAHEDEALQRRAEGVHGDSLIWMRNPMPSAGAVDSGIQGGQDLAALTLPEKGRMRTSRKRALEDAAEGERLQAEKQERLALGARLLALLKRFRAPSLGDFSSDVDPVRAACVIAGRIRNSSLKRYLRYIEELVFWMLRAKIREPPFRVAEVMDYLFMLSEKPCGPTVPGAFLKAMAWFERVSGVGMEQRITVKPVLLSARDVIVKELKRKGIPICRAPRLPGAMIASLERLVSNEAEAMGVRVGAWYRLVKCWGTLRYDDIQHLSPHAVRFYGGRFLAILYETKTSGPERRQVELPIAITEDSWICNRDWLSVGWRLLRTHADFERDFLLPALSDDFSYFRKRMASYSEVSTLAVAVNRRLLDFKGNRLVPQELMELWTEHSERATLPTILDSFGLDPRDRDALGRWRPEGSDVYSRSFSGKIRRIHRYFVSELEKLRLAGDVDDFDVLDAAMQWLRARRGLSSDEAERVVDLFRASLATWSDEAPIDQEDEEDDDPPAEEEEADAEAPPERGEGFVLVTSRRGAIRLHKSGSGGCWMGRLRHFNESAHVTEMPAPEEYTHRCRLCWPSVEESSDDSSGPESSDSSREAEDSGVSLPDSWDRIADPRE